MRLWSIHPAYLDAKGLVAAWREALLAQKVLQGRTIGYRHHPQLDRFRKTSAPVGAIGQFLLEIRKEAKARGYGFNGNKISRKSGYRHKIPVNAGQVEYEWKLLKRKIRLRDLKKYRDISRVKKPGLNGLFRKTRGCVEKWEKVPLPGRQDRQVKLTAMRTRDRRRF